MNRPNPFIRVPGYLSAIPTIRAMYVDEKFADRLGYLWARWQDEREHEDWADFEQAMQALVEAHAPGVRVVKTTRRPMTMTLHHPSCPSLEFVIKVTSREISLETKGK